MKLTLLLVLSVLAATGQITAQNKDSNLARLTVIVPKEGMQKQFEEGYKRHLQWHVDNGDKWNWYAWFIASGTRFGYFIDSTFGRSWEEFDGPINPVKDSADAAINVAPYGKLIAQFTCAYLPEFSKGTDADLSAALPKIVYFKIKTGQENTFEKFLAAFRKDFQKTEPQQNYLWYRIEDGEQTPQYFLFFPHKNFTDKRRTENFLARFLAQSPAAQTMFQMSVADTSSETMRYRADMTFIPR